MVKVASSILLPLLASHVSAVSIEHEHTTKRLHHTSRLKRYVDAFLELFNPVPQISKNPERMLTEEQQAFLESSADPRNTYLVWQGAMKVAKEAGTNADYVNPEILLPRALHQIAAVDISLAMKTMGNLLGIEDQDRFWRNCIANGKEMWRGREDSVSRRSLAFLEIVESLFHGAGARLLRTRSQREQVKRKLDKISTVHTKLDELRGHAPDTEEFRSLLENVSNLFQEPEQVRRGTLRIHLVT
ncbi:uncharacterized protein LOC113146888 [Cyclospora cayetanensis]|uniref:Uncharacterized protein LOC113146888 n=1 Tax=Cyclospora cayetanensis TaxID=88456 RepID=A0A6P6RU53_9EIME|nr:uncharacterized protein LOC113146888 [Cyclospora cayetanensis]